MLVSDRNPMQTTEIEKQIEINPNILTNNLSLQEILCINPENKAPNITPKTTTTSIIAYSLLVTLKTVFATNGIPTVVAPLKNAFCMKIHTIIFTIRFSFQIYLKPSTKSDLNRPNDFILSSTANLSTLINKLNRPPIKKLRALKINVTLIPAAVYKIAPSIGPMILPNDDTLILIAFPDCKFSLLTIEGIIAIVVGSSIALIIPNSIHINAIMATDRSLPTVNPINSRIPPLLHPEN